MCKRECESKTIDSHQARPSRICYCYHYYCPHQDAKVIIELQRKQQQHKKTHISILIESTFNNEFLRCIDVILEPFFINKICELNQ